MSSQGRACVWRRSVFSDGDCQHVFPSRALTCQGMATEAVERETHLALVTPAFSVIHHKALAFCVWTIRPPACSKSPVRSTVYYCCNWDQPLLYTSAASNLGSCRPGPPWSPRADLPDGSEWYVNGLLLLLCCHSISQSRHCDPLSGEREMPISRALGTGELTLTRSQVAKHQSSCRGGIQFDTSSNCDKTTF